jgi:hypothetical protein
MSNTLESNLFSWSSWNDDGPMTLTFSDITLKCQIGQFPVGTKFQAAFIDGECSKLTLLDYEGGEHTYTLVLSVA